MYSVLAIGFPSGFEWLIVLLVALLIFGSRLPRIMRGLGSSVREFRGGMEEGGDEASGGDGSDKASAIESKKGEAGDDSKK